MDIGTVFYQLNYILRLYFENKQMVYYMKNLDYIRFFGPGPSLNGSVQFECEET